MWERSQALFDTKFKGLVIKTAKKYLNYSSMDLTDFLSDGQIALHETLKNICATCPDQNSNKCFCREFFTYFLNKMREYFSQLADIPGECKLGISDSKKPITRIPITEKWEEDEYGIILKDENFSFRDEDEENQKHEDLTPYIKSFTKRERELFFLLEIGMTLDEITVAMGFKHKQGVYMMIQRMKNKVESIRKELDR